MATLIAANPQGFWLSLGGVLLAAEMLGASGYLLWSGVAALIVGVLVWFGCCRSCRGNGRGRYSPC